MKYRKLVIFATTACLAVCLAIPASAAGGFVGSTETDVYHVPDCYHVEEIAPENYIWWHDEEDAARYRRPCYDCRPEKYGEDFYYLYGSRYHWTSTDPRTQLGFEQEYELGLNDGYDDGYDNGYNKGYNNGYGDGQEAGYSEGYRKGRDDGYDEGISEGYEDGDADGYERGYAEASEEYQAELNALKVAHAEEVKEKQWEAVGATAAGVGFLGFICFWIYEAIASRKAIEKAKKSKPVTTTQERITPVIRQESQTEPKQVSVAIANHWYNNNALYITFNTGVTYCYYNVPGEVYAEMLAAPSAGRFFHERIRDRYPYTVLK